MPEKSAATPEPDPISPAIIAGPTSRREFIARASLLGLGVPALSTLLAGCDSGGSGAEEGAAAGEVSEDRRRSTMAAVPFERYDPALPPVGEGREHTFDFVARDETVAISNDTAMRAWTFNGTVPGPILHVRQGDRVTINLRNEGTVAHSIDLHAAKIDAGTAFRSIAPGDSLSYTFTPPYAGAFLYHCSTAPILLHIGNGMYGAVIVDPVEPLPPAREFVLVHSSFYLDIPEGTEPAGGDDAGRGMRVYDPSYEKMLGSFPDYAAFNGHAFQYRAEPIRVRQGERVRFYIVTAGPTQDCAFHVVGGIFDKVYLGAPPGNTVEGVQTFLVPSGGGMIFEFIADLPGSYPFVNHKTGHGDKGSTGMLIVEP